MAKKKLSQQEKPPKDIEPAMEDQSEKLALLKSLNDRLLKETVERRELVNSLLKSKQDLQSEIDRLKNQSVESEIQRSVTKGFVEEQIHQEKERLKEESWREKEELKALVEEKSRQAEEVSINFSRYRDEVGKEIDLQRNEADRLRYVVVELEKEIERIGRERDGVVEEKNDLEKRIQDMEREMVDVVKERAEIEEVKVKQDLDIKKLQNSLDVLMAGVERERGNLRDVVSERNDIRKSLSVQVEETKRLNIQVLELEKCNSATEEELGQVRNERRRLIEERKEREGKLESVLKDKALIEGDLVESLKVIEDLKKDITRITSEKGDIEEVRASQVTKIANLQREVEGLQATVLSLQKGEEYLLGKISELEKSNAKAFEKQEQMKLKIDKVDEEKNEIGRNFELLVEEKSSVLRSLDETLLQLEAEKRKLDQVVHEKADIERVTNDQEVEINKLCNEISGLKTVVSTLEESSRILVETNNQIQSEARQYKDALKSTTLEMNNVRKEVNLKKKEEERLRLAVLDLEKRVGETKQELERIRIEYHNLSEEKKEMASSIGMLTEEKRALQRKLVKAEEGIEDLVAKMKSSETFTEQALWMLKSTVEVVCQPENAETKKNDLTINADKIAEEIQPFAAELEAIRRAFKNKNVKAEDMNRQFESLKLSIVETKKNRNLWAWLSSVATLAAAASMAYVARVR